MNFVLRFISVVLNCLNVIVAPILWLKYRGPRKTVPTISDGLLKISATDSAEKIRRREISSEQLCTAYIKRIKEVNPILNAVVEDRFEIALQDARNVDNYLQTSFESNEELEKTKPLLGVPLTVKESCSLGGMSLCVGTLSRSGIKADKDGDAVAKLKSSGAIPLLVSNTPEICLDWQTSNFITGRTNNPYDTSRTTGGSSGGEGALLGSGASVIGIGSDVAGSIRLPAMFNCVFGHKPTPRTISIKGHFPYCIDKKYADYLVVGPMTRYSKDLKLMMKVMTDDAVLPELRLDDKVDISKIRVFFMEEEGKSFVLPHVQKEISAAVRQSAEYLKNTCGCHVVDDVKFSELKNSCEVSGSVLNSLKDTPNLLKAGNHNLAVELLKSVLGFSNFTFGLLHFYLIQNVYQTFIQSDSYMQKNEDLKKMFRKFLGDDGVLLYPTFTKSALHHGAYILNTLGTSYLMTYNSTELPSTHVPCGFDKNGLPIGIQVIAGPKQDRLCFAVAEELEKCFGGWIPPN
ncbi:fatty-acid amide hydrolase 2-A-like [Zophobas morio]|uniref:fatty-acid amide hydrolase 2-A-like n=1 Tax=Zophobas morio TaxID=2755281 RepID=UPI003082A24B